MAEVTQLRPPRSDELADVLEDWAGRARKGEVIGFSAIFIRPGGVYTADGWQAEGFDALREIGAHFLCLLDVCKHTKE